MSPALEDILAIEQTIANGNAKQLKALFTIICGDETRRLNRTQMKKFEGFPYLEDSKEYAEKIEEMKTKLTLADLISVCHVLDIDYTGSEDEVRQKILSFLCHIREAKENEDLTHEEEEESCEEAEDDEEYYEERRKKQTKEDVKTTMDNNRTDTIHLEEEEYCNVEEIENKMNKLKLKHAVNDNSAVFSLSFRDMEGSIRRFNGKDGYPIRKWIEDFEELAEITNWNDLQKLIFAKKSLDGLAKLLVQAERGVTSWSKLKTLLKQEFEEKISSAEIHRTLMTRVKKREETVQEYVLVMREIASRIHMASEVIIQYVIDGIPDNPGNKIILYGAKTFEEFKEKIRLYDNIKKQMTGNTTNERKQVQTREKPRNMEGLSSSRVENPTVRCFACGVKGHVSRECPMKEKGTKCFNCNQFGHKSAQCPNKVKNTMMVEHKKNPAVKNVILGNRTLSALFDTGSDVNLVRLNDFISLGSASLNNDTITLSGIGDNKVKTLGSFQIDVAVDDVVLNTKMHVVPNDSLKIPVVLGHEFLTNAIVKMDIDGIKISPKLFVKAAE